MRPTVETILPIGRQRGDSLLSRIGRSNSFALAISSGLHGAFFLGMYLMVFRQEANASRPIIPEACLTAAETSPPKSTVPLRLAREPAPVPVETSVPKLEELPIVTVTLDAAPDLALPAEESPIPLTSAVMAPSVSPAPTSNFFGQAGNAYKVVYVVDLSASLMIYIDDIVGEMRRSIHALLPTQRFHIVLAKPREVVEFEPRRLVPAIGRYKAQAKQFLDSLGGTPKPGPADPVEAMKRAFAVHPELIYFLTDGDYPAVQDELVQTLAKLNRQQNVKITTIGFDPSPGPKALLERIAREHGGHCRVVKPK